MDLVYVVGGDTPDDRSDLRHSLRSMAANLRIDVRDVWVVGDVPAWFTGAKMPLEPKQAKFENQRASIEAYVNHPGAAESFALLNDDMFCLESTDAIEPIRNKASSDTWNADHQVVHGPDCWTCAVRDTAAWTSEQTGGPIHLYENHTPLVFDTKLLRDLVNAYPRDRRFVVGELFALAGIGGPGRVAGNAKVKAHDSLDAKLALDMPWISGNPDSWDGALGDLIRGTFPDPSPWEG